MKIVGIEIENYGAFYGKHAFRYADRGLTMVLGENLDEPRMNSNGSAKSTLFEALDWCWYGKPPKGDHADSVVNEEAKGCVVTTYLLDDEGVEAVIRRARPASLQFWVAGVDQTTLDAAQTQEQIIKFLGMPREVFQAAVFFGQNDLMRFADVGEARRLELLSKIIPEMAEVDRILEIAKGRHADVAADVARVQHEVADLNGQFQALEGLDYQQQHDDWEVGRRAKMAEIHKRSGDLLNYWMKHSSELEKLPALEAEFEQRSAQATPQPPVPSQLADLQRARTDAVAGERVAVRELERAQAALNQMAQTRAGMCSYCGQAITKEHLEFEQRRLTDETVKLHAVVSRQKRVTGEIENQIAAVTAQHNVSLENWRRFEADNRRQLDDLYKRISALKQLKGYCEQASRDIDVCAAQASELERAVNPFAVEIARLVEKKDVASRRLAERESDLYAVEDGLQYLSYWVKALGAKGLKSYILDTKIQEMTDSVNHWVKILTGGTFWIRFSTQKKGRSTKKVSNEFHIQVHRYNPDGRISERSYKSWSGGEKGRVSLAIDMGLSRLIAQRAAKTYDVLILDELFKHVDKAGGEAIAEMLERLRHEKSSVFVVEHDAEFQSRFENRVLIRRKNARSTIVEIDNELPRERQATPSTSKPQRKAKPKRAPIRRPIQAH